MEKKSGCGCRKQGKKTLPVVKGKVKPLTKAQLYPIKQEKKQEVIKQETLLFVENKVEINEKQEVESKKDSYFVSFFHKIKTWFA